MNWCIIQKQVTLLSLRILSNVQGPSRMPRGSLARDLVNAYALQTGALDACLATQIKGYYPSSTQGFRIMSNSVRMETIRCPYPTA